MSVGGEGHVRVYNPGLVASLCKARSGGASKPPSRTPSAHASHGALPSAGPGDVDPAVAARERVEKYNRALKKKHEEKMKAQQAVVAAAQKRRVLMQEEAFDRRLAQLDAGRAMLRTEITPAMDVEEEKRKRKAMATHTEWMEKVFDPVNKAITAAVNARSSREVERDMNKSYNKFLKESSKRELKRDMIDKRQYDPFERKHLTVRVGKLADPLKQAARKKAEEDNMVLTAEPSSDVWAAEDQDLFGRPGSSDSRLFKNATKVLRDTSARLPVHTWRHSHVLTRMGRNPPPAPYDKEAFEEAEEAAERTAAEFATVRSRIMGEYFRPMSREEATKAVDAVFPRTGKRQGIAPKDTGLALLQHVQEQLPLT